MRDPKIYMAGPVGHAEDAETWRTELQKSGYAAEFLNPLDKYNALEDVKIDYVNTPQYHEGLHERLREEGALLKGTHNEFITPSEITAADEQMIEDSDAVLVRISDADACGTYMEMRKTFAELASKPVVVWWHSGPPEVWWWDHCDAIEVTREDAVRETLERLGVPYTYQ